MDYTKGNGLIIALDSNAKSKMWPDTITNQRGKTPEEFLKLKHQGFILIGEVAALT